MAVSACFYLLCATTNLNFDQHQYVKLNGEWNFYPNQLMDPTSKNKSQLNTNNQIFSAEKVQLPNSFLTLTGHKDHMGTFQKVFRLPELAISRAV